MSIHLHVFEALLTAQSQDAVTGFLGSQCDQLGFTSYFYAPVRGERGAETFQKDDDATVTQDETLLETNIFTTYPTAWLQRYQEAGHMAKDPIARRTVGGNLPVFWDQVSARPHDNVVMDEARQHGLANGITVPVNGPNGGRALFSVATDTAPEKSGGASAMTAGLVLLTAMHAHEAILRIAAVAEGPPPRLTARETACLQWAAYGKTSWEIGYILSISERTVVFHIVNATRKLNAANRSQAVVRAISLGLVQL